MTRAQRYASAAVLLTPVQFTLIVIAIGVVYTESRLRGWHSTEMSLVALVILFYLIFSGFRHAVWLAARFHRFPNYVIPDENDPTLPTMSFVIALRDEVASLGKLVASIMQLKYRKDRLEVLLLIDEDDTAMLEAARNTPLPSYCKVVVTPDAGPRLKPKCLNNGFPAVSGDIVVPFDAEDRIPADQLLRVVGIFRTKPKDRHGRPIGCVQAGLTFWNPRGHNGKSWVASLAYGEYCVQYLRMLPGLEKLGLPFPFGGTSCYFLREALNDIADLHGTWRFNHRTTGEPVEFHGPWDLNPTEDADLAWRMALAGWGSALVDSFTNEEAPERVISAGRQGTRWLHGYGITGIVSLRRPLKSIRDVGFFRWFGFNLFMLGTLYCLVLNPITWSATALYAVARWENWTGVSTYIHGLFPAPVYYAGLLATVSNFSLFIQKLFAVVEAQEKGEMRPLDDPLTRYKMAEQYGITTRILTATPFWWAWRAVSAWRAHGRLCNPMKNHSWGHKTSHGRATSLEDALVLELGAGAIGSGIPLPEAES